MSLFTRVQNLFKKKKKQKKMWKVILSTGPTKIVEVDSFQMHGIFCKIHPTKVRVWYPAFNIKELSEYNPEG